MLCFGGRMEANKLNLTQIWPQARLGGKDESNNITGNSIPEETLKIWYEVVKKYKGEGDSKLWE